MLKRIFIAIIVVASTLVSSCTREDLSMCNPRLKLKFSYLLNNQGENLFGDQVKQITVFAFDADGRYYATFSDGGNHLKGDYVMTLPLSNGKYTLLSWGGDMKWYNTLAMTNEAADISEALTKGKTTLEQFRIMLKKQENNEALELFYGIVEQAEAKTASIATYPVSLTRNSKTIRVHFTGLENLRANRQTRADNTSLFDVKISAHNGIYNYENKIPPAAKAVLYRPHTATSNGGELTYDTNTLRLVIGDDTMLQVVNSETGAEVCNLNVVEAIMKDPNYGNQDAIDGVIEFPFEFHLNSDLSVGITINGWSVIDVIPEL